MYEQDLAELSEYLTDGVGGWTCLTTVCGDDGATVLGRLRMVGQGDGASGFDFVTEFEEAVVAV